MIQNLSIAPKNSPVYPGKSLQWWVSSVWGRWVWWTHTLWPGLRCWWESQTASVSPLSHLSQSLPYCCQLSAKITLTEVSYCKIEEIYNCEQYILTFSRPLLLLCEANNFLRNWWHITNVIIHHCCCNNSFHSK